MTNFKFKPGDIIVHRASGEKAVVVSTETKGHCIGHFSKDCDDGCERYTVDFSTDKTGNLRQRNVELVFALDGKKRGTA